VQRISVLNAAQLIKDEPTQVVDIRDETAYGSGHIQGSTRIDNSNIQNFVENADKQQNLLVCCYHGHSSLSAAAFFESQGFEKVFSLDGGMTSWGLAQHTVSGE
jgi:thiosulfate sulfurtransferase